MSTPNKKSGKSGKQPNSQAQQGNTVKRVSSGVAMGNAKRVRKQIKPKPTAGTIAKRVGLGFLLTILTLIALALGAFVIAYASTEVPEPDEFAQAQVSTVYYQDGKTQIGSFSQVNRTIIETEELPKWVGNAIVASEDRTFWTNSGVDFKGIIRALWNNITGGEQQGASTLSQQYVETYYLGKNPATGNFFQRYWGKAKEAILALKINQSQTKKEILGKYMNTIYFGRGTYGIEEAAESYFGKHAKDLDYSEAALLAGIIPAPSKYDPMVDAEAARARWQRVLDIMAEDGYITPAQKSSAKFPEVKAPAEPVEMYGGINGYFLTQARQELKDLGGFTDQQIDTMGLRIITTLDQTRQAQMVETVDKVFPPGAPAGVHLAMVNTNPKNGEIMAEYPGADYLKIQRNSVTQDRAQAGSTFKVFGLAAAFEHNISPYDTFNGNTWVSPGGLVVRNYGGANYGRTNLIRATQISMNIPFVEVGQKVGPETIKETAIRAGMPEDTAGLDDGILNVLGSCSPHNIDLATAYGTFAANGVKHQAHLIREVYDSKGELVYRFSSPNERVFSDSVASTVNQVLQLSVKGGIANAANLGARPTAAKTGTSSDDKSAQFVGYTPSSLTAVSIYQVGPNGEEQSITPWGGYGEIMGSTIPAKLWRYYMMTSLANDPIEQFPKAGKLMIPPAPPSPSESESPTESESAKPSESPSEGEGEPSGEPSQQPTGEPSGEPSQQPTGEPSGEPSQQPTEQPTEAPVPPASPTAPPAQ